METQKNLSILGLSDADSKLYESLVSSGPSTVAALARRASIQRTSTYYMLSKLEKLGLVHVMIRHGKRPEYFAEKPEILLRLYDDRLAELTVERKKVKTLTHELSGQYTLASVTPKIQFDRGVTGIKRIMEQAMSGQYTEVLNIMPLDTMLGVVGVRWWGELMRTQIKHKVQVRVLRVSEQMTRHGEIKKIDPDLHNQWRERRILPKSLNFKITMWIYGDIVAFFSSEQELYAMTIQSKDFAAMQRLNFDFFWSMARKLDEEIPEGASVKKSK